MVTHFKYVKICEQKVIQASVHAHGLTGFKLTSSIST